MDQVFDAESRAKHIVQPHNKRREGDPGLNRRHLLTPKVVSVVSRLLLLMLTWPLLVPRTLGQAPASDATPTVQQVRAGEKLPIIPPNAERVAKEIGVWSLVDRCSTLASEHTQSGNVSFEELALHQQITEAVVTASLDVTGVLAEIDDERTQIMERQALLAGKRDRKIYLLSLANIAIGTGTGIVGTAMQFHDRTAIAGDAVGVTGGAAGVFLSLLGLRQQGGKISLGIAPNMLAPLFGRQPELRSIYPQDVWAYLTSAPTSDFRVQVSWREELLKEWVALGRIGPPGTSKSQKKIDLLTSRIAEHQRLSIDLLEDRSFMLLDLRASVSLMSRDLRDLMKALTARWSVKCDRSSEPLEFDIREDCSASISRSSNENKPVFKCDRSYQETEQSKWTSEESVMHGIEGLHHVTAIAGEPQTNINFYTGILGLRLVKLTVNFDDPTTYHLYYGDGQGHPGTIMTFFPWPGAPWGQIGTGQLTVTSFAVPERSFPYWRERLRKRSIEFRETTSDFGEETLFLRDADGLQLELVTTPNAEPDLVWERGPVPSEHAIRGFHHVTLSEHGYERTASLLTETWEFKQIAKEGDRFRYAVAGGAPGTIVDLVCTPEGRPGRVAVGTVHHVAWRTATDDEQSQWRDTLSKLQYDITPIIDRQYFHSIYFREPGGVLFEVATDPPGFAIDEPVEKLGESLKLPIWLERYRSEIEKALPPIELPPFEKGKELGKSAS